MKRGNVVRKADEHEPGNPFCAAHPEVSAHTASRVQCDPDEAANERTFRTVAAPDARAHVSAQHILTAKHKRK